MHICFVVEGYPTPQNPTMTFVRELLVQLAKEGVKCSVIAPQSLMKTLKPNVHRRPGFWIDTVHDGMDIEVYQPWYITFANYTPKLNRKLQHMAAQRAFQKIKTPVDCLYGHFWHMGVVASKLHSDLPIFVACGESKIHVHNTYSNQELQRLMDRLNGVIYVGTKACNEAKKLGLQKEQPYIIAPNGYNPEVFKPMDKAQCRQALGWEKDAFIVSFVGNFNSRKGFDRLNKALQILNEQGEQVQACLIGRGNQTVEAPYILHCGTVSHDQIPSYLNATDAFVLPTNNEGCCNAIVEAIGCQLPVISSNQEFNDDILDPNCSIRIDPMDVDGIVAAIKTLKQDEAYRDALKQGAAQKAKELRVDERARKIRLFMEDQLK